MEQERYDSYGLDEYIRQGESQQRERGEAWRMAIGQQQVDGLTPSSYLIDTAKQHIDGEISMEEVKRLIDSYYQTATNRSKTENRTTTTYNNIRMESKQYKALFAFLWNIANDVLVYAFEKGDYKKIILPFMVLHHIDVLLEPTNL